MPEASSVAAQDSSTPGVTYCFSFLPLWSYVGRRAFRALAERTGAEIVYKPVTFSGRQRDGSRVWSSAQFITFAEGARGEAG